MNAQLLHHGLTRTPIVARKNRRVSSATVCVPLTQSVKAILCVALATAFSFIQKSRRFSLITDVAWVSNTKLCNASISIFCIVKISVAMFLCLYERILNEALITKCGWGVVGAY